MIEQYNLNLARNFSTGSAMRRKCYFWMVVYLVFAGALLIEGAYEITQRITQVREAEEVSMALRRDFAARHEGFDNPEKYVDQLLKRIETQSTKIKDLQDQSKPTIPFLPVLFEVQKTLPKSVIMSNFEMTTNKLFVSFHFPDSAEKPEVYLQNWRGNVALAKYLEELEVVGRISGVELIAGGGRMTELSCVALLKKR